MRWIKGLILAVILLVVMLVGILFAVNNQQAIALNLNQHLQGKDCQ